MHYHGIHNINNSNTNNRWQFHQLETLRCQNFMLNVTQSIWYQNLYDVTFIETFKWQEFYLVRVNNTAEDLWLNVK